MMYLYGYWFVGPLILWSLLIIVIAIYITKSSVHRSSVLYAALMPAIFELVWAILNAVLSQNIASRHYSGAVNTPVVRAFDFLRPSFAPLPGLVAFLRMSKQIGRKRIPWLAYLGFFYVILLVIVSLVYILADPLVYGLVEFVIRGHSGFIGVFILYLAIFWEILEGRANITLLVYASMYIISEIFFLVANIDALYGYARLAIFFCLSEFPLFISILLSVLYGHLWTIEKPLPESRVNDDEEYKLETNHNNNYGNDNSLVDYDSTDSFLPPPYSG